MWLKMDLRFHVHRKGGSKWICGFTFTEKRQKAT